MVCRSGLAACLPARTASAATGRKEPPAPGLVPESRVTEPGHRASPSVHADRVDPRFLEQRADGALSALVAALADLRVADLAGAVQQIERRPVPVSVRIPGGIVVVEADWVLEPLFAHSTFDVLRGPLELELWRVHADDGEPRLVPLVHATQERQRALAVSASERPELDQHDAPAQVLERERLTTDGVQPRMYAQQLGRAADCGQARGRSLAHRMP